MKIPTSIALSLLGVPAIAWWAFQSGEESRPSGTVSPPVRSGTASLDPSCLSDVPEIDAVQTPAPVLVEAPADIRTAGQLARRSPQTAQHTQPTRKAGVTGPRRPSRILQPGSVSHSPSLSASVADPGSSAISGTVTSSPLAESAQESNEDAILPARQPAVWVDLGPDTGLTESQQQEIQDAAVALQQQIEASGLDPASPEYRELWDKAVADSDRIFRQRYGGQAWMAHHIQAFHLGQSTAKP